MGRTNGITASTTDAGADVSGKIQLIMPKPEPKLELLAALDGCELPLLRRIWDSDSWRTNKLEKAVEIVEANGDSLVKDKQSLKWVIYKALNFIGAWYGASYSAQKLVSTVAELDPELARFAFDKATKRMGGEGKHKHEYGELVTVLARKNESLATQANVDAMEERCGGIVHFSSWNEKTRYHFFNAVSEMIYNNPQLATKELYEKIVNASLIDGEGSRGQWPWRTSAWLLVGYINLEIKLREMESKPGESIADICKDADGRRKNFPTVEIGVTARRATNNRSTIPMLPSER
jgi:hypothetical protein